MLRSRVFKRSISIVPSGGVNSTGVDSLSNTTTSLSNISSTTLTHTETLEHAEFEALGNPASVVNVRSPASVPLYVRKNSLLSVYGGNVVSKMDYLLPIRRLFYGRFASGYQRLISTAPFSALVTANSRKSDLNRSFTTLVVDGATDWAILEPRALQVYTGNALHVDMRVLPRSTSRKLAKETSQKSTGLFSWTRSGYTLLTGRGQVALAGNGSIFNVNVAAGEKVLVNRENLLGLTVNGPQDLSNCVYKYELAKTEEPKREYLAYKDIHGLPISPVSKFFKYFSVTRDWIVRGLQYLNLVKLVGLDVLSGRDFVNVTGPRNLLLQLNVPSWMPKFVNQVHGVTQVKGEETAPVKKQTETGDRIGYVSITPEGAKFENTKKFEIGQ